jgi:hypothetical protein
MNAIEKAEAFFERLIKEGLTFRDLGKDKGKKRKGGDKTPPKKQ